MSKEYPISYDSNEEDFEKKKDLVLKVLLIGTNEDDLKVVEKKNQTRSTLFNLTSVKPFSDPINRYNKYKFNAFEVLQEFSDNNKALNYLEKLSVDKGILAIMKKHEWSVGLLKEIHPLRESDILGYNLNKGQAIGLRLRTNKLDGFRHYREVRRVLLHELTHMIHSDHDEKFHNLNKILDKEVNDLDWTQTKGYKISNEEFFTFSDEQDYKNLLDKPNIIDRHGMESKNLSTKEFILNSAASNADNIEKLRDARLKKFQ
ncbi:hypothetical protein HDU92_007977 [Lobulomyces angularis]|nr:hypothetical protein HDU92_007977 [Lobulomyces angularis]